MEAKPLEIKKLDWSYDRFMDGREMERIDIVRKSFLDPIPETPHLGDLYFSPTTDTLYRYDGISKWKSIDEKEFTTFGIRLLHKKDNETKEDRA